MTNTDQLPDINRVRFETWVTSATMAGELLYESLDFALGSLLAQGICDDCHSDPELDAAFAALRDADHWTHIPPTGLRDGPYWPEAPAAEGLAIAGSMAWQCASGHLSHEAGRHNLDTTTQEYEEWHRSYLLATAWRILEAQNDHDTNLTMQNLAWCFHLFEQVANQCERHAESTTAPDHIPDWMAES